MRSQQLEQMSGEIIGVYNHPKHVGESDWRATLYIMPAGNYAIGTNGDPIFEGEKYWEESKEAYGF